MSVGPFQDRNLRRWFDEEIVRDGDYWEVTERLVRESVEKARAERAAGE